MRIAKSTYTLGITHGYTAKFHLKKKKVVGHNPSIRLTTHRDIRVMVIGCINLIFPPGKAMKHGDHCREENIQQGMTMM